MKPVSLKLFLLFFSLAIALKTNAQVCKGSLGDPVINETFGHGQNTGKELPFGITDMKYTNDNCPEDGYYTIVNAVNLNVFSCHSSWQTVTHDHTGDPNGYMMLVNANYDPSIFFTQVANGLCPNTTYEFSAYIMNLITLSASGPNVNEPNITFSVETKDGTVLATYNTGIVPPTDNPTWNKYGTYFVTPEGVTDVVVKMTNNAPGGNGNDLVLDDIAFRACGPIIQTGFGDLASTGDQNICEGNDASFLLKASVGEGFNNPHLQWQLNNNNGGWTDIPGENGDTYNLKFNNAIAGLYQYRLAVAEGDNLSTPSCYVSSLPLTLNVNPLPVTGITPVTPACEGEPLVLHAAAGADSYFWTGPNNFTSTAGDALVTNVAAPGNSGQYTLRVIAKNCPVFVTTSVNIYPRIVPGVSASLSICVGESTTLTATGGLSYKWSPSTGLDHDDIPNPVATPALTTTYKVAISNQGCTDSSKSVTVTVYKNPTADAGRSKTIFEGQSVRLEGIITGDNITDYYWTPSDFLDDPKSLTPIARPVHDITYTLSVVTGSCGIATSNVFIRVYEKIIIPNAFTPNGDGINDNWNIRKISRYPEAVVLVYDRIGHEVFRSTGYNKPWDGTANNSPVPPGTYYYIIDLKNGTPKQSGWVLVAR